MALYLAVDDLESSVRSAMNCLASSDFRAGITSASTFLFNEGNSLPS